MFAAELVESAARVLTAYRQRGMKLVTAESCTGGLVAAILTEIAGSSDVLERGFVAYSNASKTEILGVPAGLIDRHGAVSANVAIAMADGALGCSKADVAVSVTGIAGPGGGTLQKPIGLVYVAVERRGSPASVQRFAFGDIGRHNVRIETAKAVLRLLEDAVQ